MIIAVDARPLVTRQIGGAEQHARNIVAHWASVPTPHKFILLFDKSARENFDSSMLNHLPANFEEILISSFVFPGHWLLGSRVLSAVDRTLRKVRADVFHSFTPVIPHTNACPLVQTIHDLSFELDPAVRRAPGSADLRRITSSGVNWASRIIAVSSQTRNDIAAIYHADPEKIDVVHNGINPIFMPTHDIDLRAQIKRDFSVETPYILTVGADIPRRNYARLFEAMQIIWKDHPALRWIIAGRGQFKSLPLYELAQNSGHLDRLVFVTSPTDQQLAQLYRDSIITVCASSFEGFGLSVLESMACGTPVACSDMRSLREVADTLAVYFPHDDPVLMADSILGLIDDADYRRQLKYKGVQRAAKFTWAKAAQDILKIHEQTISSGSSRKQEAGSK
jgi:glycosyltransferase involved in cell wall biosynthesis